MSHDHLVRPRIFKIISLMKVAVWSLKHLNCCENPWATAYQRITTHSPCHSGLYICMYTYPKYRHRSFSSIPFPSLPLPLPLPLPSPSPPLPLPLPSPPLPSPPLPSPPLPSPLFIRLLHLTVLMMKASRRLISSKCQAPPLTTGRPMRIHRTPTTSTTCMPTLPS